MTERQKLNAAEIERRCVTELRTLIGMHHVTWARITALDGNPSWTWDLAAAGPDAGPEALEDARGVIDRLRQQFDLA
ncbi:hypothetical protein SAMN05444161_4660 [Rhizobiales bacterium GAS191]|nr:hypothetical protein SAMN05519103_03964 [Rhizobiales bacterium GAS113]SEE02733.1 hypothetical protein SAMN05444161_4660 [Rhizobiales bacterium GAS191]